MYCHACVIFHMKCGTPNFSTAGINVWGLVYDVLQRWHRVGEVVDTCMVKMLAMWFYTGIV